MPPSNRWANRGRTLVTLLRALIKSHSKAWDPILPDGDQPIEAPKEAKGVKEVQEASKDAKEVQLMVRKALAHPDSLCASSSSFWPGFVWLVESSTEGVIFCTYDPF